MIAIFIGQLTTLINLKYAVNYIHDQVIYMSKGTKFSIFVQKWKQNSIEWKQAHVGICIKAFQQLLFKIMSAPINISCAGFACEAYCMHVH